MDQETVGTVLSVHKQWWLKINTKPVRTHPLDGAVFPYIIKVRYRVQDQEYTKRKWIPAGQPVPSAGSTVKIRYNEDRPNKAKVIC